MNMLLTLAFFCILLFSKPTISAEIPLFFGEENRVSFIYNYDENSSRIKVNLKGSDGEDLYIANRTSAYYFLAGIYFWDHGYK